MSQPTVSALVATHVLRAGMHHGLRTVPQTCRQILQSHPSVDVRARVSTADFVLLWEEIMIQLRDHDFPLKAAKHPLEELHGLINYMALVAPTAQLALTTLTRYWPLVSDGTEWQLTEENDTVALRLLGLDHARLGQRCAAEYFLSGVVWSLRSATRGACLPSAIRVAHALPAWASGTTAGDLRSYFVESNQNALIYPRAVLAAPLHHLGGVLLNPSASPSIVQEVARVTEQQLRRSADVSIATVAKQLAASARTLQRRLAEEGTSFLQVLEGTRKQLALELLVAPERHPLKEIAVVLGFVAVRSFERAFRRWTGQTPGAWRQQKREINTRS